MSEWKMVPVEPTGVMLLAADSAYEPAYTGTPSAAPHEIYRAMLAAAPDSLGEYFAELARLRAALEQIELEANQPYIQHIAADALRGS